MTFADTVRDAVADFAERGYRSQDQLEEWITRLRRAAEEELVPQEKVEAEIRRVLESVYSRMIVHGTILIRHPDVARFTLDKIKPASRMELQSRIFASADLIKLNRNRAIEETLQRFSGWASSVPRGGATVVDRRHLMRMTRGELRTTAFQARRVGIDQGHKFAASLDRILADESDAIAAQWHQHYTRQPRIDHTRRDKQWYLIRDSWAHRRGLVKPGPAGYLDDITQPGEEVLCRCTCTYASTLGRLPPYMLTERGRAKLAEVRARMTAA